MNLFRLAARNIQGSAFRSWVVAICALLVAGFTLAATLIARGTENSLRLALERLGADIIVVPSGAERLVEGALLMGHTTRVWMPLTNLAKIAALPGVQAASPQMYLSTMTNASCCSVSDMFLVAYDPQTDFTIQPWLLNNLGTGLKLGEGVGGTYVFTPKGEQNIRLYGYMITLKANLEPTGTGLDQSMFITFETAREIARMSKTLAQLPLDIPLNSISVVMVKLTPGYDSRRVALEILQAVPGVNPIESPDMFQAYRLQMKGILKGIVAVLSITWALSLILIALVFTIAATARRRELGVLRAMGATRGFVLRLLISEAGILALQGGVAGIALSVLTIILFRSLLIRTMGLPFILPALPSLVLQILIGLGVTLLSVALAALIPSYRASHQDPALAMRE
jgi:putative ABC transport system permease protein